MFDIETNRALITRLVKYQRVLRKLKSLGLQKVFANNLGDAVGTTATIVRKDFSMIAISGNKRGGYDLDKLANDLAAILGPGQEKHVVLVGCGRIGTALMNYREFLKEGIKILAGFDLHPENTAQTGIPVYPISELSNFVRKHKVTIGVIAVPETAATQVFQDMINCGIKGILNFTSVELKCQGRCERPNCQNPCTISNVNIGLELENLFYLVHIGNKAATTGN